ncbi:MAG: hypothetical protein IPL62_11695 [Caulobacteraceae bacterium]|jgi:hypothetical protein|nr:hypothetical protein [Caulobacteraceae bacterium]MBK8544142.1 hypothetical protein [Caulobacteraceae bacterium]
MEHAIMTPIARLLRQGVGLRYAATQNTKDVNEAYFVVHEVMTDAFARTGDRDRDLGSSLACALVRRSRRLANAAAIV